MCGCVDSWTVGWMDGRIDEIRDTTTLTMYEFRQSTIGWISWRQNIKYISP